MPIIEISVDSLDSAIAAEQGGAQRVELCSGLREGGLTPSLGLIRAARTRLSAELYVLIRPRAGDFLYSDDEFRIMRDDIALAAREGADGVVVGILTPDGAVDVDRTAELVELAHPLQVTFHRAFDLSRNLPEALADVIRCGADRILTSGGAASAVAGIQALRQLVDSAEDRISILVGGGVRPLNIAALAESTRASEFHSSMRSLRESAMRYRNPNLSLGDPGTDEYALSYVDQEQVRQLVTAAQGPLPAR